MASTPVATLKRIAPQYATLGDAELGEWIALAMNFVSASVYGSTYSMALAYVAAALLTEADAAGSGVAGPLIGRRAGEVSENYAAPLMSGRTRWEANSYGRMFLSLRDQAVGTKALTTSPAFGSGITTTRSGGC